MNPKEPEKLNDFENSYNTYTKVQKELINKLSGTYSDANLIIRDLTRFNPSMYSPVIPLGTIDEILTKTAQSVVMTLMAYEDISITILNDLNTDTYESHIDIILDKIAYGVVSCVSKTILTHLVYYLDPSFIFSYIRESIVRVHLTDIIKLFRESLNKKDLIKMENDRYDELVSIIDDLVYSFMISHDTEKVQDCIRIIGSGKYNYEDIRDVLLHHKYFVPDFLYQMFNQEEYNINTVTEKLTGFLAVYTKTFTENKILELCMKYAKDKSSAPEKIKRTTLERLKLFGLNEQTVINNLTIDENMIAQRIIDESVTPEDHEVIKQNKILHNIQLIYNTHKSMSSKFQLSDRYITVTFADGKTSEFNFKSDTLEKDINDPFMIFGMNKDRVKVLYTEKPFISCLCQTGMSPDEVRFAANNPGALKFNTAEDKIKHRNEKIKRLKKQFATDTQLMQEVDALLEDGPDKLVLINPMIKSSYQFKDEKQLLRVLAETEGLHRRIEKYYQNLRNITKNKEE